MGKPPPEVIEAPGWDSRSETPRVDAFIEGQPLIPMRDPGETAGAIRALMLAWAEFARELEREINRKVWPH